MIRKSIREPLVIFGLFVLAIILFVTLLRLGTYNIGRERKDVQFGVTFSKLQAEKLNLDWRSVYIGVLDDLRVRVIRVPLYWDDIEAEEGVFVFDDYHWMIAEAAKRGVEVIPVLGMRVPRWPECHIPPWAESTRHEARDTSYETGRPPLNLPLRKGETKEVVETTLQEIGSGRGEYNRYLQSKILKLLEREVNEFKHYPNIRTWQIENEPLLSVFGVCPFVDLSFTEKEFSHVRSLDPTRKLMGTESGEMSSWIESAKIADMLGSSLYRITFNPLLGMFYYPIPPLYYRIKAEYVGHLVEKVIISELQAEPWIEGELAYWQPEDLRDRFSLARLKDNVSFARKTQFDIVLLWGVEWWAYMRERGIPEYWEYARTLF